MSYVLIFIHFLNWILPRQLMKSYLIPFNPVNLYVLIIKVIMSQKLKWKILFMVYSFVVNIANLERRLGAARGKPQDIIWCCPSPLHLLLMFDEKQKKIISSNCATVWPCKKLKWQPWEIDGFFCPSSDCPVLNMKGIIYFRDRQT